MDIHPIVQTTQRIVCSGSRKQICFKKQKDKKPRNTWTTHVSRKPWQTVTDTLVSLILRLAWTWRNIPATLDPAAPSKLIILSWRNNICVCVCLFSLSLYKKKVEETQQNCLIFFFPMILPVWTSQQNTNQNTKHKQTSLSSRLNFSAWKSTQGEQESKRNTSNLPSLLLTNTLLRLSQNTQKKNWKQTKSPALTPPT